MSPDGGQLGEYVGLLENLYGRPVRPPARGPFEMVLWENVAYLQTDERHEAAFRALKKTIGTEPERILTASRQRLLEVTRLGGMHPEQRVDRLREIAEIAMKRFDGDLAPTLRAPVPQARRKLMTFPSIGEPAAEKILLFCGAAPLLALDSNGLRVLLRLGFGQEKKSYAATYRCVQQAAMTGLPAKLKTDCGWLAQAHQLLRRHGKELCRRSTPLCEDCPLGAVCPFPRTTLVG